MDMHDCPFLVVFDINEDLTFAKIKFLEEGNITATGTYMFLSFWDKYLWNYSNLATIFLIAYFCSISLNATVPLLLYCVQGAANIE